LAIVLVDVHYDNGADLAGAAAIVAQDWSSTHSSHSMTTLHHGLEEYRPGQFYKRELPCILPLLKEIMNYTNVSTIVIDGYVDLKSGQAGLGRQLHDTLKHRAEVVGIAKNYFSDTNALPVYRGLSRRSLWVSSTGDTNLAAKYVSAMAGEYRIPTLVKQVDSLARELIKKAK